MDRGIRFSLPTSKKKKRAMHWKKHWQWKGKVGKFTSAKLENKEKILRFKQRKCSVFTGSQGRAPWHRFSHTTWLLMKSQQKSVRCTKCHFILINGMIHIKDMDEMIYVPNIFTPKCINQKLVGEQRKWENRAVKSLESNKNNEWWCK